VRIDEKRQGVLVVTFTREHAYWWESEESVSVNYQAFGIGEPVEPPGDDGYPPDRTVGVVSLSCRAVGSGKVALSAAHRLALAVLCGDDEGASILADMVLLGDAK